jgi:hypothetical protein
MQRPRNRVSAALQLLLVLALAVAVTWWASTPAQRTAYVALLTGAPVAHTMPPRAAEAIGNGEGEKSDPATSPGPIAWHRPPAAAVDCRAPTRSVTDVELDGVYRWTDDDGQVHFSDRPPVAVKAVDLSSQFAPSEQFARVSLTNAGSRFATEMQGALAADVAHMGRILRDVLEIPVRQIDLDVTLYGSADAMRAANSFNIPTQHIAGVYEHGRNRVVIADQTDFEATRRVARHELSHAMLAGIYGYTPFWLNEGLAEAMSALDVVGHNRVLTVLRGYANHLRTDGALQAPRALATLLSLDATGWHANAWQQTYAPAWALVHELLSHADGRELIRAVLAEQQARPCEPLDSPAIVDAAYPGGLDALELRWQRRMRDGAWRALGG